MAPPTVLEYGDYECPYSRAAPITLRAPVRAARRCEAALRLPPLPADRFPKAHTAWRPRLPRRPRPPARFWEMREEPCSATSPRSGPDESLRRSRRTTLKRSILERFDSELAAHAPAGRVAADDE